jgi:hypothetical protein
MVGAAAGLATADDVGRREMIGLAATAQVAILIGLVRHLLCLWFSRFRTPLRQVVTHPLFC